MPKGNCPKYLYHTTDINKPIEEIWQDIQGYSSERFPEDNLNIRESTNFTIIIPPIEYKNKFIKGLYMSNGVDCIQKLYPNHQKLFFSMATSMWSSYPWSNYADIYMTSFDYPQRLEWFKKKYPQKADKIFIPLQDADFTNEYFLKPLDNVEKDIDILSIAQLNEIKHLEMLIEALTIIEKKYGYIPKATLITGNTKSNFGENEKNIINKMIKVVGNLETLKKYINFIGHIPYSQELCKYYNRAKCTVLTSIFEGKNRMISESLCCNVPVVTFNNLCKFTKGNDLTVPKNAGVSCYYNTEALADSLHYMIHNYKKFTPRDSYLKHHGRKNFVNKLISYVPYYRENIPELKNNLIENSWFNEAFYENYQLNYTDYLYGKNIFMIESIVNENNHIAIDFYLDKFEIK